MKYKFRLARDSDEAELRAVHAVAMKSGDMNIAFLREPNFFIAERSGSYNTQTMLVAEAKSGNIIGCGSRSERYLYVDGVMRKCGYLHGLRKHRNVSTGMLLMKAYKYFHQLHNVGDVPYYFTTILSDNVGVQKILTSNRFGLPRYIPYAKLVTCLIPISHKNPKYKKDFSVQKVQKDQMCDVVAQINKYNAKYLFAPHYNVSNFNSDIMFPDFHSDRDMYIYSKSDKLLGTVGVWDQSYKQTVIMNYSTKLKAMRHVYNLYARYKGYPLLPSEGGLIKNLFLAFVSIQGNREDVFQCLLEHVLNQYSGRRYDYLSVGFCQKHPLLPALQKYAVRTLGSNVYLVCWGDDVALPKNTNVHVEIATL